MHDKTVNGTLAGRTLGDPEGFERYIPPVEEARLDHPDTASEDLMSELAGAVGVVWEYTYSRFGRAHGPHTIQAPSLPEAKDGIRRRHRLPDYRGIRIHPAA